MTSFVSFEFGNFSKLKIQAELTKVEHDANFVVGFASGCGSLHATPAKVFRSGTGIIHAWSWRCE